jgi:hypothetical protein
VLKSFTLQLLDGTTIQINPEPLIGEADSEISGAIHRSLRGGWRGSTRS